MVGRGTRRRASRLLGAAVAALLLGSSAAARADDAPDLDAALQALVDEGAMPGAVALLARHGQPVATSVVGRRDVAESKAMTRDTIFRLYSMSKPITSVAIMVLAEEGALSLDDPVSRFLPELAHPRVYVSGDLEHMVTEPARRPITIADLLTHTSGITYHFTGQTPVHAYYRKHGVLRDTPVGRTPQDGPPARSLDELVARIGQAPLLHQPGETFAYSYSTTVLGAVIERVSGKRLDAFLEDRVFGPLGMKDTGFFVSDADLDRFVTNYQMTDDGLVEIESPETSDYRGSTRLLDGGGALAGTADDYLRFARMLANGGQLDGVRLLSPQGVSVLLAPRVRIAGLGTPLQFGYGFAIGDERSGATGELPSGTVSWSGSGNTFFWIWPATGDVVVFMTQVITPAPFASVGRVLRIAVLDAWRATTPARPGGPATGDCGALRDLDLDGAEIESADIVDEGSFEPPPPRPGAGATLSDLPPFCRARGVARPVPGSRIGFEIWMPSRGWTRRLQMFGNGGYSSAVPYAALADRVRRGDAAVATDTGHDGDDPSFAVGHPESIVDWGERAVHVSLVQARAVASAFYGRPTRHAYFTGCSTGGQQALMEAQRHPEDFDGIAAGAPGHNRTHLNAGFLWQFVQNHTPDGGATPILPASKLSLVTDAVLRACGPGVGRDAPERAPATYLADPLRCAFDPGVLQCAGGERDDCLTGAQVEVLRRLYDGPRNPRTGERIYYGLLPGSESGRTFHPKRPGWSLYWADPSDPAAPARASFWRDWAFGGASWDWWGFDFDHDMAAADDRLAPLVNAMDADLRGFRARGGKLIQYHGLADPVVPATDSVGYQQRVVARMGDDVEDFYRLFLAPGVGHCGGGPGPNVFDVPAALEAWVEKGEAPDRLVASRFENGARSGRVEYTRPLCPFPKGAAHDGGGDVVDAASFACADSEVPPVPEIGARYLR